LIRKIERCILLIAFLLIACERKLPPPQAASEAPSVPKVLVEREKAEREQPLPPEVKIKLKRDGKESYSWELSGSDADQVLKVNEKLRKRLGGEASK
jgi:hypothetical protein